MTRKDYPGKLIGFRKNGRPIYLQAGGSIDAPEQPLPTDNPVSAPVAGPQTFYTEADLERVRKEEKDKLYRRLDNQGTKINALEEQLKQWQTERETAEQARQAAEREAEEARRRQAEEELSVRELLNKREAEWNARLEQVHKETEAKMALLQKDRELAQLQAYIQRRVSEERENIAPQLVDLINGNTPEEVEASISLMRAKTEQITAQLQEASSMLASNMRGVSPSGYAVDGPLENNPASKTITAEALGSMPLSEYAKNREHYLGAAASHNGGLFG